MKASCHKSVSILIWSLILPRKPQQKKTKQRWYCRFLVIIIYRLLLKTVIMTSQDRGTVAYICLLLFYILETSKTTSGWVPTFGSAHSWRLHSAASLEVQANSTMTWYPTQSHYSDTDITSLCPALLTLRAWLEKATSHWCDLTRVRTPVA